MWQASSFAPTNLTGVGVCREKLAGNKRRSLNHQWITGFTAQTNQASVCVSVCVCRVFTLHIKAKHKPLEHGSCFTVERIRRKTCIRPNTMLALVKTLVKKQYDLYNLASIPKRARSTTDLTKLRALRKHSVSSARYASDDW